VKKANVFPAKSQGEVEVFMNYAKGYHGSQILLLRLALRCMGQVSKTSHTVTVTYKVFITLSGFCK
jgi:RNA binding exosome subunit